MLGEKISAGLAGDYPLLGPSQGRVLFTVDTDTNTEDILRIMRDAGVRYAYVPTFVSARPKVAAKHSSAYFDVAHVSEEAVEIARASDGISTVSATRWQRDECRRSRTR